MYSKIIFVICLLIISQVSLNAQHHAGHISDTGNRIKHLTDEQINGYLNGFGMGLAKAAELNHYPGPKHVMDLTVELGLTENQLEQTKKIFKKMEKEAIRLGKGIVQKEAELDSIFKTGAAESKVLRNLVTGIAELQGELRFTHLRVHIQERAILTEEQVELYDELRGYKTK